jgi:hypothetical protein
LKCVPHRRTNFADRTKFWGDDGGKKQASLEYGGGMLGSDAPTWKKDSSSSRENRRAV